MSSRTLQGLGPSADEAELRRLAAALGPNRGRYKRVDGVPVTAPVAPPAGATRPARLPLDTPAPVTAGPAPTSRPRRRWRTNELIPVIGLGVAAVAALGAVAFALLKARPSSPTSPARPSPPARSDFIPAKETP